ncbi:MAG: sigma-70 family RNA polymerase sigma factor [Armatimonadetes bacterium]|nr:sigma-70 family RNA polymerase sigma factor [Armatimonadota bacterium]
MELEQEEVESSTEAATESAPQDSRALDLDEERLIHRCRAGDADACAALIRKYAALVYSVPLHNFGMSQDDAEDVYQLAYMKVLNRARQFRGESRFSAWLRTVVRNICVDCLRSQKSTVSLEQFKEGCENCPLTCFCHVDGSVKRAEERSVLEKALANLPDHYRKPIELFFFEEKSYREISEILNEPINTVGTHINRGLARLRKQLGNDPESIAALIS